MQKPDPYATPQAEAGQRQTADPASSHVADGRRLIVFSIGLYLCALLAALILPLQRIAAGYPVSVLVSAAPVSALIGVCRLTPALGCSTFQKVALLVLMCVPFANLVTLLLLHARATGVLRDAGFRVGLLRVSRWADSGSSCTSLPRFSA